MSTAAIELVAQARAELNRRRINSPCPAVFEALDDVKDPEIPVLSIWELGILQNVELVETETQPEVTVTLTPTYSGCPALGQIERDVRAVLHAAGYLSVRVQTQLAPAWTTDWLTAAAARRLRSYGIAPPNRTACPQCGSERTQLLSEFGSTACKSLRRCQTCGETFDHFKPI